MQVKASSHLQACIRSCQQPSAGALDMNTQLSACKVLVQQRARQLLSLVDADAMGYSTIVG